MDGFNNSAVKTTIFLLLFVLTTFFGIPQNPNQDDNPKVTRVTILNADSATVMQNKNPDKILYGNVIFFHDSIFMYCDSAYMFSLLNSFEAFDNVKIIQGDTLFIYSDYMVYYANDQLAKMRNNVKMEDKDVTLFTDSFDYDRKNQLAYYFNGGMIVDSANELTSVYGQYSPETKKAFFKDKVKLINPDLVLTSDTLNYDAETKIATIVSPSVIETDSGFVYSSQGWYNTVSDESMLYNRSLIVSKDSAKTITADSIFYNRKDGIVVAFGNMILNDTVQKVIVMGNYGYYDEKNDYAFATDSAKIIEYSQSDSSYIHADTIIMRTIDSIREVKAYYGVRLWRTDLQGVCDSLKYNTSDSILRLYKTPIIWNEAFQITGDTINILFNDSTIERMHVLNYAFALEKIDSTYYNQLKGRNMTFLFDEGELYEIGVEGNGETIYYNIDDKDAAPLQLNKISSPFFIFSINLRKISRLKAYPESETDVVPIPDLTPELKFLPNFVDYNYIRPKDKDDIFAKSVMKTEDIPPPRRTRQRSQQE